MDCGQFYPGYVLDMDHVRGPKEGNVATLANAAISLDRLQAEIEKCDVVCANCHRIRTHSVEPQ